jgi:uncharacterized protein
MKNMKKSTVLWGVLALTMSILLVLGACSSPSSPAPAPPVSTAKPAATGTTAPTQPAAAPAQKATMYIGATVMASDPYPATVALCNAFNSYMPNEVYAIPRECTGGTTENLQLMKSNEIKIGFVPDESALFAQKALALYADQKPMPDLRMGWFYGAVSWTIFVAKDSGITEISQIDGKDFGEGYPNSNGGWRTEMIFKGLGIKPKFFVAATNAVFDAYKNKKVIGTIKAGFPDAMTMDAHTARPVTILGVPKDKLEEINKANYNTFPGISMKAGIYPGQDKEIWTFIDNPGWCIDKSLSADTVYKMCKAIKANEKNVFTDAVPEAMRVYTASKSWEEHIIKYSLIPLHAGVVKYLKEAGYTIPSNLIPPEAN